MFDLFGKLWLKGVKRLLKAQTTQHNRQRKLNTSLRKAGVKAANAAVKAAVKSTATAGAAARKSGAKTAAKTPATTAGAAPRTGTRKSARSGTSSTRKPETRSAGSASARPAPDAAAAALSAGGSWRQVYQTSTAVVGATRSRRLGGWLFLPDRPAVAGSMTDVDADFDAAGEGKPCSMPLVVMLHGCGQTATAFATGTRMNRLGARHGFAVLYPQQSVSAHAQRCWPWYRRSLQEGGDELALIAAMIERTCERHGLDSRRVYAAGLSAGAALAHNLALRRPDLIAAVAMHSGPVHGAADSRMSAFGVMQHGTGAVLQPIARLQREQGGAVDLPSLIIQGEDDQVVRPVNARQLLEQCCAVNRLDAADAAAPRVVEQAGSNRCRITDVRRGRRTLVRLVEVAHLAHAWSGGDAALRYNAAAGPDASAMLWEFFRHHAREHADASVDAADTASADASLYR